MFNMSVICMQCVADMLMACFTEVNASYGVSTCNQMLNDKSRQSWVAFSKSVLENVLSVVSDNGSV